MSETVHSGEPQAHQQEGVGGRLNWLRAGVLGANDGIVSTAGIVMGVAGAADDRTTILIGGFAGLIAGAFSMAAGEYVSVSTQRDAELALLAKERRELAEMPQEELDELTEILEEKGLTPDLAAKVAEQLHAGGPRRALRAHAMLELGLDPDDVTNPWAAAGASMLSFTLGALIPLLAIMLPAPERIWVTVLVVTLALAITGYVSARLGFARAGRAVLRNICGGLLAMGVTYGLGSLLGTQL